MGGAIKAGWIYAKPWVVKGLKFVGEAAAAAAIEKGAERFKERKEARKKEAAAKSKENGSA